MGMARIAKDVVKNNLGAIPNPGFITYFITYRCNHRCGFCEVWKRDKDNNPQMTVEQVKQAFSTVPQVEVLRVSGGEPFLREELPEIVNHLNRQLKPQIIHFTTNGFLSKKIIEDVGNLEAKHKVHVKVSIDAVGERHDQIRGLKTAYSRAMATVAGLSEIAKKNPGMHVGVNQAIVQESDIPAYFALRKELAPYGASLYPVIAHQTSSSLYDDAPQEIDFHAAFGVPFKPIGKFNEKVLRDFIATVVEDGNANADFKERWINNYHWKGLYNRLLNKKLEPKPPCMAVRSHMRVLPNGDVPICLYNKTTVGNLVKQSFQELWRSDSASRAREWVDRCSGCWQSCEMGPSAIFTGDIVKGMSFKVEGGTPMTPPSPAPTQQPQQAAT